MGSARRFGALLAAGVAIVVLYVRAGESPVVLVLALVTLVVGLVLWETRPWLGAEAGGVEPERGPQAGPGATGDPDARSGRGRGRPGDLAGALRPPGQLDTWRSGHDLTWDERGIRAVAVGNRMPHLVVWSRIDAIDLVRHRAAVDDRRPERRRGIRLALYRPPGKAGETETWLCVGPDQDIQRVTADLRSAWRDAGESPSDGGDGRPPGPREPGPGR
jgi:hypothetical protein